MDLALASVALLVLSPVMLVAMALVAISGPGGVLFRQERIGLDGRRFTMLKFRTMHAGADDDVQREMNRREILGEVEVSSEGGLYRIGQDPRITQVGRILRAYSIDELPQLLNVLAGDMSLVGPRPSLAWEVELFTRDQLRRHETPPGLTGLWQVSGRNRLSMAQMLELDLDYLDRRSPWLDLQILVRTPRAVLVDRATG